MVDPSTITVIVEIPKGSRNKYEFDEKLGRFKLDRMLFSSVHYPTEYGFVLETLGDDGDPLDALVIAGEPTFTGCAIDAKPLGLFRMRDEKGLDDKVLSVPIQDPQWNWMGTLDDVPKNLLSEIQHFFSIYKDLEDKGVTVEGWQDRTAAIRVIDAARKAFREAAPKSE